MSGGRALRRVLVANRGEIAVRVIRTCRRLGIETVLTVSDADAESLPARLADRVVRIGPAPAYASYLNVDAVVGAAVAAGADAVHPGYGFLSENARLARACAAAGIVFIGPGPDVLEATGDKLAAREHAVAAGLPVLPGGHVIPATAGQPDMARAGGKESATATSAEHATTVNSAAHGASTVSEADPTSAAGTAAGGDGGNPAAVAARIGYPVLVKAAGGGGGRGLRVVRDPAELDQAVALASAEAEAAFGDPRVYLERYVERGRHVEVQLLGDGEHVIHLGDRDCSVQRRYQKLIEEAPAPGLDDALRERLRTAAVALGERLRYRGAGTVEFLLDTERGEFYFLEVNARVQVEHPVTEAVTGLDIVAEQLALAEGRPLRLKQADVTLAGHAIEVRLNAEDPAADFRPSPGTITRAVFPATTLFAGAPPLPPGSPALPPGSAPLPPGAPPLPRAVPHDPPARPARPAPSAPNGAPSSARAPGAGPTDTGPGGGASAVRVDTHLQAGAAVPPYYDSLLAKVIARAGDRDSAIAALRGALDRCAIDGVTTNLGLHRALLADAEFAAGGVDTGYLSRWLARDPLGPGGPGGASPGPVGQARPARGTSGGHTAPVPNDNDLDLDLDLDSRHGADG